MIWWGRLSVCAGIPCLLALSVRSAVATSDPASTRLTDLARVWITVDYFHPYLAYKNIDWDRALLTSLPKIRAAHSRQEVQAAYKGLLDVLGDDESYAGEPHSVPPPAPVPQRSRFHQTRVSGFLTRDTASPPEFCVLELEDKLRIQLRLSEPAANLSAAAAERKHVALDESFPPEEARILAVFRLWGAVRYFFAYKDLIDADWDGVFAEYLPKFIGAHDAREYHLAAAEFVSHLSDSNSSVKSAVLQNYFGEASPFVRVRLIEKKPTITQISEEARKAGAKLGDVITKIDGENAGDRIKREANYLSASAPAGLGDLVARTLLNGPSNQPAILSVARAGGLDAEISLPRSNPESHSFERPAEKAERTLPGGSAYLDLEHLSNAQFHSAFQKFEKARAVILDLRSDCALDPFQLTEAFPEGIGRQASIVTGPTAYGPDLPSPRIDTSTSSYFQLMRVPKPAQPSPAYRGKVVLLIDERTRGASEQALLLLSAAAHVQTVGSPTAGAPSETTTLRLPGNISFSFSAQDVRLTNGGAIQRQGIQPALTAPVTLSGVRAGRDEPLDVAQAWLKEELSPAVLK